MSDYIQHHIPDDLILKILIHLPAKSLLRFRSVSKQWRSLIENPCFVNDHRIGSYNRPGGIKLLMEREREGAGGQELMLVDLEGNASPVSHPLTQFSLRPDYPVVGVEGLICFGDIVWNPTTRKSIHLPPRSIRMLVYSKFDKPQLEDEYYLGFDASTKHYKVLNVVQASIFRTYNDYNNHIHSQVLADVKFQIQVFTLGTTSWKDISHRLPEEERKRMRMCFMARPTSSYLVGVSLYLKNEIYFLIQYFDGLGLMVFCVGNETFKFLRLPNYIDAQGLWDMIEVHECVALVDAGMTEDIWILTDFDTASWERITQPSWLGYHYHYVPNFNPFAPVLPFKEETVICSINSREVLVQSKWWTSNRFRFDCSFGDVRNKTRRRGPNLAGMRAVEIYSQHVETLFDPTALRT